MNRAAIRLSRLQIPSLLLTAVFLAICLTGSGREISAHGDEDHGAEQPKVQTTGQGLISRTARLDAFEIMLRHSALEPDTAVSGRLFVTNYETNEPVGNIVPSIQIESADGAVTTVEVQKTDFKGSFGFNFPALQEGSYTVRVIAATDGKTSTATFSGVEVTDHEAATAASGRSWLLTGSIGLVLLIATVLFAALVYFAVRGVKSRPLHEETVSP